MAKYSDEYEKTLFKRVDLISLTAALFTFIVFNVIFWYSDKNLQSKGSC